MQTFIKKHILTVIILGATFILAGVGIFTAIRLYQLRNQPVAPNVPASKPAAQDIVPDGPDPQCTLTFNLGAPPPTETPVANFRCVNKTAYYPDANGNFSETRPIANDSTIAEGAVFYYKIAYSNDGTTPISSFTITDTLSDKLDYISTLQPSQCVFTLSQRQFKCIFSNAAINPGDAGSVILKVKTKTNISGDISNNAIINYGGFVPSNCIINLTVLTSTATPTSTASPTATGTASPTATATSAPTSTPATCNNSCTNNSGCASGLICSDGACRNVNCTSETDCTCAVAQGPTSTPKAPGATTTPELPDAGISIPTILGSIAGVLLLIGAIVLAF